MTARARASGETDLQTLLSWLKPCLSPEEYAFATIAPEAPLPPGVHPIATIWEEEGLTIIATAAELVRTDLDHQAGWARIVLTVHSSLAAVGLTARVASALADKGISANFIAGYHHDHIFVPWPRRAEAMAAIERLAEAARPPRA